MMKSGSPDEKKYLKLRRKMVQSQIIARNIKNEKVIHETVLPEIVGRQI